MVRLVPMNLRKSPKEVSPVRILLLEDDVNMLATLTQVLKRAGYAVTPVQSSTQAVEVSKDNDFDLVITDIRMEGKDGLEALEAVKERQPEIQSIVVTGFSTEQDSLRAMRLGVREYMKKPFEIADFRQAIGRIAKTILEERRIEDKASAASRTLLWALESHARTLGVAKEGLDGLVPGGEWVFRLARALDFSVTSAKSLQLAFLCAHIQEQTEEGMPEFVLDSLPDDVEVLFELPEDSLELSILRAGWELAQDHPLGENTPPEIARAFHELTTDNPALKKEAQHRRGLLSVGSALEESKNYEGALLAYADLCRGTTSQEAALAFLGSARVYRIQGQAALCREAALAAFRLSRNLGPLTFASIGTEAGTLLAHAQAPEAQEVLENTAGLLQQIGFQDRAAQARLSLSLLRGDQNLDEDLLRLFNSPDPAELERCSWWLLAPLLERQQHATSETQQRVLTRLVEDHKGTILQHLRNRTLSPAARAALVGVSGDPEVLKLLVADDDATVRRAASSKFVEEGSIKPPMMRFFTLGRLDIYFGEDLTPETAWKRNRRARLFLTCLATQADRYIPEDVLIEEFWPQENARGRQNLYSICSVLRKSLRPEGWEGPELEFAIRTPLGLRFNPELPMTCDLQQLEGCLERAKSTQEAGTRLQEYRRAVELYRGPFLESCYMNWAETIRTRIQKNYMEALLEYVRLASGRNSHSEALEVSQRLLELDNCNQDGYRYSMISLSALGRPEEAIRTYERCVPILRRELGLEPSIALLEQYHKAKLSV